MGHNFGGEPQLVRRAAGAAWFTAFIAGSLVLAVVLTLALGASEVMPWWGAVATTSGIPLTGIIVWAILPRRVEVYDDRLVIVFGFWRWNIGLESIESVEEAAAWKSYAYTGMPVGDFAEAGYGDQACRLEHDQAAQSDRLAGRPQHLCT